MRTMSRLLDLLEAAHRRAVEGVAVLELPLVEHAAGIDTCCITPGRSQNRRSTNSTSSVSTSSSTSFGDRSSMAAHRSVQ